MSYLEIIKKMNRVIASCTDKKQLPMAEKYCAFLIGRYESEKVTDIARHFDTVDTGEELLRHRDLLIGGFK